MGCDGNWKVDPDPDGGLQVNDILRISSAQGIQVDRTLGAWGTNYDGGSVDYSGDTWSLTISGTSPNRRLRAESDGGEGGTWTAQEQVPPPPSP